MLSNRPETGRTFTTALWAIGALLAVQMLAAGWAVLQRKPDAIRSESLRISSAPPGEMSSRPPGSVESDTRGAGGLAESAADDFNETVLSFGSDILPPIPEEITRDIVVPDKSSRPGPDAGDGAAPLTANAGSVLPQPTFMGPASDSQSLSEALSAAALAAPKIEDPILEALVSTGEEHRASGNMQGALRDLREAETALPDHPRVIGGLAATLSQMGLDEKASAYWERLLALGSARAGAYYGLAEQQLRGDQAPRPGAADKVMKVGEVKVEATPPGEGGQRVSLRVVIDADPARRPSGEDISLLVYFYDQVEGARIEPSTADTSELYPTEPYDWQIDGTEEIVVNYFQPVFTEEQSRELGERRYYGYVLELYYRDQLQDKVIMPPDLAKIQYVEPPGAGSTEPAPPGPENALFPDTTNP